MSLGATHALASGTELTSRLRAIAPARVRYAFEAVGSSTVLESAIAATARGGTTVAIGIPGRGGEVKLSHTDLVAEGRSLRGAYMGSSVPQRDVPRLLELWRAGRLPVERLFGTRLPLDRLPEALDALSAGSALRQIVTPGAAPILAT